MIGQIFQIIQYIWQNNPKWLFPFKLFSAVSWQVQKRLRGQIKSKNLFNGQKIFLYPHTPSASSLVYSDLPDKKAINKLRELATSNTIFLDIGANIGLYSLSMIDKVQTLYAFEAHPETANLLKMNFLLNQISDNHIVQSAVSDKIGHIAFSNQPGGSPINAISESQENAIQVPTIDLDTFIKNHYFDPKQPFILKLDVEGAEHLVLKGASEFLRNYSVKAILFETFSNYAETIIHDLKALNFDIQPIMENNLIAIRKDI